MIRKMLVLVIIMGILFGVSVGGASADEEPPPTRGGEDPPPSREPCELEDWELAIAERLAERYDVEVVDITYWYCMEYAFGEIALAYEISIRSDYTVEEIFAMREAGLTWEEILEEVGLMDGMPYRWRKIPWEIPPRPFMGHFAVSRYCVDDGTIPQLEKLAELYGLTYEQVYQWVCGPFDFTNFDWDDLDFDDLDGWEYNEGERMHITAPDWVLPDIDGVKDLLEEGRSLKRPPGIPRERP